MSNRLLDPLTRAGIALTAAPLLLWGGVSVACLTHATNVSWWIAWIPAVATSGVMIAATRIAMTQRLDRDIRRYAGWLSGAGILADILAAGAQHYLEAQHATPPPELAALMGGLPSLMGGLLIHIVCMVSAQARREVAEAERAAQAVVDAAQARRVAEAEAVEAEAAAAKRKAADLAHQRELATEAERAAAALREKAAAEQQIAAAKRAESAALEAVLTAKPAPGLHLIKPATRKAVRPGTRRPAPLKESALRYLAAQHEAGIDIDTISSATLDGQIGASPGYSKKQIRAWREQVREHAATRQAARA